MEREIRVHCTPGRETIPALPEKQVSYLLIELAPDAKEDSRTRLPLDICLLLDNSSSMRGDRLFQAKEAARYIVNQLTPDDYFSLVTFNDQPATVVPRQAVQAGASIREHISDIQASGGTEMARALEQALEQMYRVVAFHGVRRIILLTDGQTYGDDDRCVEAARRAQKAGIGITAMGVGAEWNEDLVATIAAHGNSRSEFIANSEAIIPLFREEMRLLQGIVAQEMSLILNPAHQVAIANLYRVAPDVSPIALSPTRDGGQAVPLGEWLGAEAQAFMAELLLPPLSPGEHRVLQVAFSYRLPRERSHQQTDYDLRLRCVHNPGEAEIVARVRQALEKVTAHRLQETAWQEARRGNIDQATRRLEAAATRLVKMGEEQLARAIEEEARRMRHTGRTSAIGKKEIVYGTQRLGRRRPNDQ